MWSSWPLPALALWLIPRTVGWWNKGWWRWASCDENGRLRALEGDGVEEE